VFKDKDVNSIAKALKEYNGEAVSPTQLYNHLRKWRQKWSRVCKPKDLSGALFDTDTNVIMLEGEHYLGHYKIEHLSLTFLYHFYVFQPVIFNCIPCYRTILRM
jgi:hypothetical protein